MSVGSVPVVASVKPDYEKVTQVKPDLVVYDAEVFNAQDIEKIKGLGFETFVIDAKTIPDFVRQVQLLGSKVAAETNASKYADKVLESYRSAQADPIATPPSVAVLLPGEGTEHMIAGASSFVSECVKAAGGTFVGPDSDKYVSLSPEFLISENPSLIVIPFTKDAQSDAKSRVSAEAAVSRLLADGRLANVSAIKSKKILPVDGDVLLRRGYRLNTLIDDLHRRFAGGN
jgi:ABC-type Fe3+-hydroxamate transport system substrate-binding protein